MINEVLPGNKPALSPKQMDILMSLSTPDRPFQYKDVFEQGGYLYVLDAKFGYVFITTLASVQVTSADEAGMP